MRGGAPARFAPAPVLEVERVILDAFRVERLRVLSRRLRRGGSAGAVRAWKYLRARYAWMRNEAHGRRAREN